MFDAEYIVGLPVPYRDRPTDDPAIAEDAFESALGGEGGTFDTGGIRSWIGREWLDKSRAQLAERSARRTALDLVETTSYPSMSAVIRVESDPAGHLDYDYELFGYAIRELDPLDHTWLKPEWVIVEVEEEEE